MKRVILGIFIIVLGVGLFGYPFAANYLSKKNGSYQTERYDENIKKISDEELIAEWDEAVIYNENLSGSPAHDPFIEESGMVRADNYYDVLNISDTMGYITIPIIDVKLPIYHGTASETLQKGVGHLEGSHVPVGGIGTHSVLTGHSGLPNAKLFTDLTELEEGETFYLHILNETLAYKIDQIMVVEPNDTEKLKQVQNKDYCTLITCTPYGVNSHRLLIRGERTAYEEQSMQEDIQNTKKTWTQEEKLLVILGGITAGIMLVLIIITVIITKKGEGDLNRKKNLK